MGPTTALRLCLGDPDQCISHCNDALRLNPTLPDLFYNRGRAYLAIGDYRRAHLDCSEAIRLNPAFAEVYYCRSLVHQALGDAEQE
jgi:tetratricopeptide (TPR) repeat protein